MHTRAGGQFVTECVYTIESSCTRTGEQNCNGDICGFEVVENCRSVWSSGSGSNTSNGNNTGNTNNNGGSANNDEDCSTVNGTPIIGTQPLTGEIGGGCAPNETLGLIPNEEKPDECIVSPAIENNILNCLADNTTFMTEVQNFLLNPENSCVVADIAMFLGENGGCTDENKDFIESIIESLEDGIEFDEENLEFYSEKPLDEFDDKCEGIIALWQRSIDSGNEVFGVLTMDGAILVTQEGSPDTVGIGGLYEFNGITNYQYPISHGAPSRKYIGQVQTSTRYFIPIKTTIHTHSPCQNEGSDDGLTTNIIEEDQSFAAQFSNISHYAIGCGAIGQFCGNSNYIFNIEFGELEELCENIN